MALERAERPEPPTLEGTQYRHLREIGRGGMGSVHEVEHRALGKVFVMKVLHESLAHRDDFALRMQREWRTLARLEHAAIVQVTDAGRTSEGLPFFVMERLDGQTLADALARRGRFPVREAVRLVLTVLSGLEAAHRAGAIHRDIKPQNLFLTARGPKILDFGIVKSRRRGAPLVTRSGVAIGTPRYMAPEQAAGLPVDGRADIYACGLVLFELIAGHDPFCHLKEQSALVAAQLSEVPCRLDDVRTDIPAPLGDLVARWLAKAPEDRPASARLARTELEALLPLLEVEGEITVVAPRAAEARPVRPDESTAGTSGFSEATSATSATTMPPPAVSHSKSQPTLGRLETLTLDAPPGVPALPLDGPSATPPPLAAPVRPHASSGRWALAAVTLLLVAGLVLGALVLRPELGGGLTRDLWAWDRRGASVAFDFPETGPSPSAPASASPVLPTGEPSPSVAASTAAADADPAPAPAIAPRREDPPRPAAGRPGPLRRAEAPRPSEAPRPAGTDQAADMPGSGLW